MRYTKSNDGEMRANVNVTIRLTAEEYSKFSAMLREMGEGSLRDYLANEAMNALYFRLDEQHADFMKYIAKGDKGGQR